MEADDGFDWDLQNKVKAVLDFVSTAMTAVDDVVVYDRVQSGVAEMDYRLVQAWSFLRDALRTCFAEVTRISYLHCREWRVFLPWYRLCRGDCVYHIPMHPWNCTVVGMVSYYARM